MKNFQPMKTVAVICTAMFFLSACQKEISGPNVANHVSNQRFSGTQPDDPGMVCKTPLLISAQFAAYMDITGRGPAKKDSDRDGIPNYLDACPYEKETMNGYQDSDGCPDTVPSTLPDTDEDGIPDIDDACPTQKETMNGYQDKDGCPDTIPDTDGDGVDDLHDLCLTEPETFNGYEDEDGCPDTLPIILPPTTIPAGYQLVTPTPGNQGNEGSCVPFAIAYGARSIEQYYAVSSLGYSPGLNVFSPEYAYNQTKFGDCGSGTSITAVLDLIKNQGICTWQMMPYSDINGCSLQPDASQLANALTFKIASYVKIVNSDSVAIKTMIASKHPVITTIIADNSFVNAGPGFIWRTNSGSGVLPHTIIICGYDDAKHAYKVMNSWGTSWGDSGFTWIDYDLFPAQSSYYTYVIQ